MERQIPDSGQNLSDSGCSSFEQEADLGLNAILGSCSRPICPCMSIFYLRFENLGQHCSLFRRPSDHCKLFYNLGKELEFYLPSWCVRDCTKVKCRSSCQLLAPICATMKKRICSKKLKEWDLSWAYKRWSCQYLLFKSSTLL